MLILSLENFCVTFLTKVPYPSRPCGRPLLKRPHGRFRGVHSQGEQPAAVFYPLGHRTPMHIPTQERGHVGA
jgi:hypothetical protein